MTFAWFDLSAEAILSRLFNRERVPITEALDIATATTDRYPLDVRLRRIRAQIIGMQHR